LSHTNDTSSQLAAERVPDTVLDLGGYRSTILALVARLNRDALLAVDLHAGGQAAGQKVVLLSSGNKDTVMTMRLLLTERMVSHGLVET
jgi:hypothetical protein